MGIKLRRNTDKFSLYTLDQIFNYNWSILEKGFETIDSILTTAKGILSKAEAVNAENKDVQQQLDNIVIASGTSDAETAQARGEYSLLYERLDAGEEVAMQTDFVEQVKRLIGGYDTIYYKKVNSVNWIEVILRKDLEHVTYSFRTNTYDDFVILGDCYWGTLDITTKSKADVNYTSLTGTWDTTAVNNHFTEQVGATVTGTFSGERVDLIHYADNRGGIWEFVVDNDTMRPIKISTYSATATNAKQTFIIGGLENKEHTIVGTFKGADPSQPPVGGAARGYVWYGATGYKTFRPYVTNMVNNRGKDLLGPSSNKEFASEIRKAGTTTSYNFVPMHSNTGTAFKKNEPQYIADGRVIDLSTLAMSEVYQCSRFSLAQSVYGRNPNTGTENLMEVNTLVTINKNGDAEIAVKQTALVDIEYNNGYGIMGPFAKNTLATLISSKGNRYEMTAASASDYKITNMPLEEDTTSSFAAVRANDVDFVAAVRFNDIENTLRSEVPKNEIAMWVEDRDGVMFKVYPRTFRLEKMLAGQSVKYSGTFNCGKVPNIYNLL